MFSHCQLCHFFFLEKCSECASTATKLQAVKENRLLFLPFQTSSEVHPTSHSTGASSTNPRYILYSLTIDVK